MDSNTKEKLNVWPKLIKKATSALQNLSSDTPITLLLEPLYSSFENAKCLELFGKIVIGRQVSRAPSTNIANGFFSSRVLSRNHAEIWSEDLEVYIKDIKSSNGTYLNGSRLSEEGHESQPFRINNNDLIEFGVDILDDSGEVQYQRISCKAHILKPINGSFKPKDLATILRLCETLFERIQDETLSDNKHSVSKKSDTSLTNSTNGSEDPRGNSSRVSTAKLTEETKLVEEEKKGLEELSHTVSNLVSFYNKELEQILRKENSKISKLREDSLFYESQFRHLEESSTNREIVLLEEIKDLKKELLDQRQEDQSLKNENAKLLSLLTQHCSLSPDSILSTDPLKPCPCQSELSQRISQQSQHYEAELSSMLYNNITLRERNDKYLECLNVLSDRIGDLSFNIEGNFDLKTSDPPSNAIVQP